MFAIYAILENFGRIAVSLKKTINSKLFEATNLIAGVVKMDISRRLGTLVVCAVPAIIGGGIIYGIFGDYVPVFIYETLLILVAGALVSR